MTYFFKKCNICGSQMNIDRHFNFQEIPKFKGDFHIHADQSSAEECSGQFVNRDLNSDLKWSRLFISDYTFDIRLDFSYQIMLFISDYTFHIRLYFSYHIILFISAQAVHIRSNFSYQIRLLRTVQTNSIIFCLRPKLVEEIQTNTL